jgi:hypothetical protein
VSSPVRSVVLASRWCRPFEDDVPVRVITLGGECGPWTVL